MWINGSSYSGQFQNGKKHGKGKWIVKDTFVGHTEDQSKKRSSVYTGEFQDDYKSGFGTMIWSTGGRYDGQFLENKRHGQGKMIWCDGTIYEGGWRAGLKDGLGKLTTRYGSQIGTFKNDKFVKDQ